jgi:hypothetical protein
MDGVTRGKPLGPEERMFGGKGILVRFKPNLTDDSPEKSDMPAADSSPASPQAAEDPMLPAMNGLEAALHKISAQVINRFQSGEN